VTNDAVKVWLAGSEAAALADLDSLDEADRTRAARLVGSRKESEWLASRALRQRVGLDPGAPTSLSHAAGHAALVAGPPGYRVGVDLEAVKPRQVLRLATLSFGSDEAGQLESLGPVQAVQHFHVLWTLKEACAKALGLQLLAALRDCRFLLEGDRWHGILPFGRAWDAAVWLPRPGLVLAAVVLGTQGEGEAWDCREWPGRSAGWPKLASLAGGNQ